MAFLRHVNVSPFPVALIPLLLISNTFEKTSNDLSTEPYSEHVSKEISIDLGQQLLFLLERGVPVRMYPVSSGKALTPTPVGEFQVYRKQDLRISRQAVPYRMPYYLSFTENGSHGIHALPYLGLSPSSSWYWSEALNHIGTPVSHGCVRLLPNDALALYEWAEVGMPVTVSHTTALGEFMGAELSAANAGNVVVLMVPNVENHRSAPQAR